MAISVTETGNVYDLRGPANEKSNVDTTKIVVGCTYFEVDGDHKVWVWTGSAWSEVQ